MVKNAAIRVRYSDRHKTMNGDPSALRWVAYLSVFNGVYETVGDGVTRRLAFQSAVDKLPDHVRRHFVHSEV